MAGEEARDFALHSCFGNGDTEAISVEHAEQEMQLRAVKGKVAPLDGSTHASNFDKTHAAPLCCTPAETRLQRDTLSSARMHANRYLVNVRRRGKWGLGSNSRFDLRRSLL